MNIEFFARKAVNIIKSKWGLPKRGILAGGSISNIIWELVSGRKSVVSDIDIFIYENDQFMSDSLFNFRKTNIIYCEEYSHIYRRVNVGDFYSIVEATRDGIFNFIRYNSNISDMSIIIDTFDINCTKIGYDISNDRFYWTKDFEEFLITGLLKITNLNTPSHTAIRLAKKSKDLKVKIDNSEFDIISYVIDHINKFNDIIKLRFTDRYLNLFNDNYDLLKNNFKLVKDTECENFVSSNKLEKVNLYKIIPKKILLNHIDFSHFENSNHFLFYLRNIYLGKFDNVFDKLYFYYTQNDYIEDGFNYSDVDLINRLSVYAPNCIENLKGLKFSEQVKLVKNLFDKFKYDPIIAISILEKFKMSNINIDIEDQSSLLLLELYVRKNIISPNLDKINKILNI